MEPRRCAQRQPRGYRRVKEVVSAAEVSTTGKTEVVKDPFDEVEVYNDSWLEKLFLKYFATRMSEEMGKTPPKDIDYDTFIGVGRDVIRGRTTMEAQAIISKVFGGLFPPEATARFRKWFPPSKTAAELNAWITSWGFRWLVGPLEVKDVEIEVAPGKTETWSSGVQIKKCRYLENSKCVGMCVNMCKLPTQDLFTNKLGLPLTMNPNFEDLSCEMIFGKEPPPIEEDEASGQPCYATRCVIASSQKEKPCHRLKATE